MNVEDNTAVITSVGVLSPIGNSLEEIRKSLESGTDGIAQAQKIDTCAFKSHLAAEVKNVDFAERLGGEELADYTDPYIRFAICAAKDAVENSGLSERELSDAAIVVATCNAGMNSQELEYKHEADASVPYTIRDYVQGQNHALARAMASSLGIGGGCFLINIACAGSTAAAALAQMLINQGKYSTVLCGGADAISVANFAGFSALKVVGEQKTAPFSLPEGMNIGEGAAFWVVESALQAKTRKAKVLAKIIGHATTNDAHHPTQPDPRGDGAFRTMREALESAGVPMEDIGCINAHGSGTSANDRAESKAMAKIIGDSRAPFVSTKSYHGHCMGATGIIEATCQLAAMHAGFVEPTLHFTTLRPGCLIAPAYKLEQKQYDCFLSANYAFAGNNAAIVVAKEDFSKCAPKMPNMAARPVISGFSAVSPLGLNAAENIEALQRDKIAIGPVTRFPTNRLAGTVNLPNPKTITRRVDFSGMNLISQFATIATFGALEEAGIKTGRANSENIGIAAAICGGADYDAHMRAVFLDAEMRGDISCFSNVTANSTAGRVSQALEIKGPSITFTSGYNCSIQALEYAAMLVKDSPGKQIVALAADEISKSLLEREEKFGMLRTGESETLFKMKYFSYWKTVLAEGACAAVVEDIDTATKRGAKIYGEILSCASSMDGGDIYDPNIIGDGLERAVDAALKDAGIDESLVDIISWSPRATAQDSKIVNLRDRRFGRVPMATTVFNTGYMFATSALHSLACLLATLSQKKPVWPQHFGIDYFDSTPMPNAPKYILALSSSSSGNNHAAVIKIA